MLKLFAEFMHIYFWVYIILLLTATVYNVEHRVELRKKVTGFTLPLQFIVGVVLFIMSFNY